ncbi:MAG: histidine triad family protein [Chloroflexota bacterium]|jgi:histidine triad (HIT) family protein|nr:histidine triad family protein [Chloroflexota bacterium]
MACLFCQIVQGEIPATVVFKGDGVTAFRDINPQAPTHVLVIPDQHIGGAAEVTAETEAVAGRLIRVAAELARQEGIEAGGYRLIVNQGRNAGQTVDHLHVHLLGGKALPGPLA